jgi:autonomous glycyl radical cofactor GrcA
MVALVGQLGVISALVFVTEAPLASHRSICSLAIRSSDSRTERRCLLFRVKAQPRSTVAGWYLGRLRIRSVPQRRRRRTQLSEGRSGNLNVGRRETLPA